MKCMPWVLAALFLWFFASSITTAYLKAPQHDDVMFASVSKSFLSGGGWSTRYGEPIPFNPDISTGPTLWVPCAVMISLFGAQTWTPAMTGVLMNIVFALMVIWQISSLVRFKSAACFSLLLALSLFAVNDFKTFTAYYSASLIFLFALLFVINPRYSLRARFVIFGSMAAIGLYAKPLILLSFLAASLPLLFLQLRQHSFKPALYLMAGFLLVWLPWHAYKTIELSKLDDASRDAHREYSTFFFEHHGTGIAQLRDAEDKISYLKKNTRKNFNILSNFLADENDFPFFLVVVVVCIGALLFLKTLLAPGGRSEEPVVEHAIAGIIALVILANMAWYVIFSFAMTPGHAFFLTFFSFFLLFFLLATQVRQEWQGMVFCVIASLFFQVRHAPMIDAYSFRANDVFVTNKHVDEAKRFLETTSFRYPLASCGYAGAPWRMEFLLDGSGHFLDCYNLLEDALTFDPATGAAVWHGKPDFTLFFEGLGLLAAAKSQAYVLEPLGEVCLRHVLFDNGFFFACEIPFDEMQKYLEPDETARQLVAYRRWYKTRLKPVIVSR